MSDQDYPMVVAGPLPLSLHEDMPPKDLIAFKETASRVAHHAEALVMQAWLLSLAADLEKRPGANAIELSFDEETPELKATARLHTDHGVVAWLKPGHTSITLSGNHNPGRPELNGHRSWFCNAMSDIPSSIRIRGAVNDLDGAGTLPSMPLDPKGMRDLSLCLTLPAAEQRAQFKATLLSRQMASATGAAPAPSTPRPRV